MDGVRTKGKSQSNISATRVYANFPRTPNAKMIFKNPNRLHITHHVSIQYKHNKTFVYLHVVLDCFSEGQDIVEGHFGRTTVFDEYRPCDARVCFTHFPWGTPGCQLSFHCVPLQYLMVHFFRLKRNVLERKKP